MDPLTLCLYALLVVAGLGVLALLVIDALTPQPCPSRHMDRHCDLGAGHRGRHISHEPTCMSWPNEREERQ